MTPPARTAITGLIGTILVAVLTEISLSGCASQPPVDNDKPAHNEITVSASDDFCEVSKTTADTGTSTFVVTNNGTKVTEFYAYGHGDRVIGAVENLSPTLQRKLTVQFTEPGSYFTACKPGMIGDGIRGNFTVEGTAIKADTEDSIKAAADRYKQYVTLQTMNLVTATEALVGTIRKGDVEGAQELYSHAHAYYERIRPVAELFPSGLDARINLREADVRPGQTWTGFHHVEKDLWQRNLPPDTNAIAGQLLADVKELDAAVRAPEWTAAPATFIAGTERLLDDITKSAITGDTDIFSHTDLWDFQAALDGSRTAVGSARPLIDARNPGLGTQLDQAFATTQGVLDKHHWNGGFVSYTDMTQPERQELSHSFVELSAVVRRVPDVIAQQ
ncbi:peptidase M75 [Mycobacterium sp. CBMA 234]|uniref:iron uptake system protein EfeO n=1 Tax=Mycolicibacterium sp. CBMA 234 TaxID=1918495 RepID=UPI0012DD359E|nr:iron uptake system protein EfeO [Mycolicibacterium sp. CBMA 234]MUL64003.1 peptidase M75 [Mycolicibacterium sp. CBMA 234]